MASSVLDASAYLAYLRKEAGWEYVAAAMRAGAVMSTANFAEVATYYVRGGGDEAKVRSVRAGLLFPLMPVDDDLAIRAALLEPYTRSKGRGLGDRICLALAARLGVPALTADREWAEPAAKAGIAVEMIR